ncbi:MAG: ketoacyl-ACP synthase III [Thermonemataceae bacterium]|nr:ketoacyl-ACP synthase III [Thermonemataceae bacterium]
MYISQISAYIPENVVSNQYFEQINGLTEDWIVERTGIRERRKLSENENTNTLAIKAVEKLVEQRAFCPDLIVGGTYTPYDTIHTLAHSVQNYLNISDIPVLSISTACSSFLNAMEVVEGYFASNKATNALVVLADHNTFFSNDEDKVAGHLWGDGAVAMLVSKEKPIHKAMRVLGIRTGGAGNIGKAKEGVFLRTYGEGFKMPFGKDVFLNACQYMAKATKDLLSLHQYDIDEVDFFVPHQANLRITKNVAETLGLPFEKVLSNIEYLGNTGCAGSAIALCEHFERFENQNMIAVTVFGGGYSYGSMLLRVEI